MANLDRILCVTSLGLGKGCIKFWGSLTLPHWTQVSDRCPLSCLFQNLNLGKTSTNPKCHLTISLATSFQYQCVCKISSQYSRSSAKLRPMKKDISQSLRLDLVNINDYAEVYQNILLSSRDKAIFTFSEFGARQSLDR